MPAAGLSTVSQLYLPHRATRVKLESLYEALPAEEREVMALLLRRVAPKQTLAPHGRAQFVFTRETEDADGPPIRRPSTRRRGLDGQFTAASTVRWSGTA
jgi:hypothetical protein